jgi:hypothetical protein
LLGLAVHKLINISIKIIRIFSGLTPSSRSFAAAAAGCHGHSSPFIGGSVHTGSELSSDSEQINETVDAVQVAQRIPIVLSLGGFKSVEGLDGWSSLPDFPHLLLSKKPVVERFLPNCAESFAKLLNALVVLTVGHCY